MSKLSNTDARTIRHAREAIGLLISGAIRNLESDYGPNDNPDRSIATDALILHLREEMEGWLTSAEMGNRPAELTIDETSLSEQD